MNVKKIAGEIHTFIHICIVGQVLFSPFANGLLPFVSSSIHRQTTNLHLHDEQTVNRLRKIAGLPVSVCCVSMTPCVYAFMSPCLHVSMSPWFHVSMSSSPCLHVHVSTFSEFRKRKTELITSVCFL